MHTEVAEVKAPPAVTPPRRQWPIWGLVLTALALLSILANGYTFGISDQDDQIPLINRILDSSFLRNDWFVNSNEGLNVRSLYSYLMAGVTRAVGIEIAFFIVYLIGVVVLATAVFLLGRAIWHNSAPAL